MNEKVNNGIKCMWELVRRGDAEQGLALMRENYNEDSSPSHIMELGVGYLWTKKYEAAWEHFEYATQMPSYTIASYFGMAGATKWCTDEPDVAVKFWKSGLDAQFADGAGGVHLPLLLWVSSVLRQNAFSRNEATQILLEKVKDPRVKNWPGALAQFILKQIDEKTLEERSIERISQKTPPGRAWLIEFYKSVVEYEHGDLNLEVFREIMKRITDTSVSEWSEERTFLSLLWNEEFFIARHEVSVPSLLH